MLALHLTAQNAGLIIRKQPTTMSVETFELSTTTAIVTNTIGRVVRRFPGPVIAVSDTRVNTREFRKSFTQCLVSLESQTFAEAVSEGHESYKDTNHPHFATEWLPGILRGIGTPVDVTRIHKRTRDEVLFRDGLEPVSNTPCFPCLVVHIYQLPIANIRVQL